MTTNGPRKKILLVDDTYDVLQVVGRRLQSWGFEPVLALSGEEALRLAEEQRPDLILLDVMMPKMKGREVCARLKANPNTKHIPIIFLTALGLSDHVREGLELGAEDYIVKPFEPAQLKERITVCLLRREQTDGDRAAR